MASTAFIDSLSQGSTTKIQSNNNHESYEKRVSDNRNYFLKMFMAELKHQDPTQPMDTQHITNTMASLTQAESSMGTTEAVNNIAKYFHKSMLTEAENYIGKNVYYDNSVQELQGENIEFEYEIKCDKEKLPRDRQNITRITIKDDKAKIIYQKSLYTLEPGLNKFKWDGITSDGKIAEKMKKYKIEVRSGYNSQNADGKMEYMEVETQTNIKGKVSEAFRDSRDNVRLKVGTSFIGMDKIQGLAEEESDKNQSNDTENYLGYIGKKITVDQNSTNVKGGFATIKFDNPLANAGRVKIEILNSDNGLVSYAMQDKKNLPLGIQNFTWDGRIFNSFEELHTLTAQEYNNLPKAKDGIYKYNVYIEDLATGSFQKIDTKSEEIITGVDFSTSAGVKLISKNGNYDLRDVKKIEMIQTDETSLALSAANYVGKYVTVIDNKFGINSDGSGGLFFPLEMPQEGYDYGAVYMRLLNDRGAVLHTITKPESEISYLYKFPVPQFEELRDDSKQRINQYVKDNSEFEEYVAIPNDNIEIKNKINQFIKTEFYSGKIFTRDVDPADEADVSFAHMGLNKIVVDESKLPKGTYKYALEIEIKDQKGRVVKTIPINSTDKSMVVEARVENGDVKLVLENNTEVWMKEISGVGI
jgi:flagellar hook assembly protein FlgD